SSALSLAFYKVEALEELGSLCVWESRTLRLSDSQTPGLCRSLGFVMPRRRGAIFQYFQQDVLALLCTDSMQQGTERCNVAPLAPDDLANVLWCHTHLQNAGGFAIHLLHRNRFGVIHKSTDDRAYKILHVASPACRDLTTGCPTTG